MKERRKSPRINKTLSVIPWPARGVFKRPSRSENISTGGVKLLTFERLETGMVIELGVYLPELKKPIIVIGEVLWHREMENAMFPFVARIKFIKVDHSAHLQLLNHIEYCALRV